MNVLVTGATGFLGGWVTRALSAAGHSIRALVRRPDRGAASGLGEVAWMTGTVLSADDLKSAMRGADAVVHCAGNVSRRPRDGPEVLRTNVEGTHNVLAAALASKLRVLHTSSIACIGPTLRPRLLAEDDPRTRLNQRFAYVESKLESERLAADYAARGLDVVVLSPGSVMGPGDPDLGSTELPLRYVRGELRFYPRGGMSFCDVRDVAEAYVAALDRGAAGDRYVLAGINWSYRELQAELQRLTGLHRSFPLPPGIEEWAALWSEIGALARPHSFENLSLASVGWGNLFHFFSSAKAEKQLDYRLRDFSLTLADTIADHLQRGKVRATTPELRALLLRSGAGTTTGGVLV